MADTKFTSSLRVSQLIGRRLHLCSCAWMIFEGFAPVKIKIVGLLGEDPNTDMIEKVCIFMWNFLTYTAAINQNFGVLVIHTFKHTISFKLSLPGHFSRFEYFTEVIKAFFIFTNGYTIYFG